MSAARDVVRSGLLFLHCESRCLPATFATSVGKQSGGEARRWRCERCRLRVSLWAADCTVVMRTVLLFLLRFAAGRGEQSGGEARRWRCEMCRLRVMLRSLKLRSAMRVVSLSCFGLRRGEENNRVERQDIGGVKCVGCARCYCVRVRLSRLRGGGLVREELHR